MNQDSAEEINSSQSLPNNSLSFQIDPEFKNLIPPLSSEEKLQLEANLKQFGCLDPLIVWRGQDILLDGHNRYEICAREQIPYNIVFLEIADRKAALSWIANHQLGRRNITPEVASYLRGKRYLNLKGDRTDNLKQNSPKCKSCTSEENDNQDLLESENPITVDAAKTLAQQYKVSVRTVKNDARFTDAVDTLGRSLGDEVKQIILSRNSGLTKKDVLSLAQVAESEGHLAAQKLLSMKRKKSDIVQQIRDKQHVPNPYYVGEVCRIIAHNDPDLKPFSGCWCIVYQINPHSCGIKTWKANFEIVKPENLEKTDGVEEEIAAHNCDRLRCLANLIHSDYEATHVAVLEVLGRLKNPSSLTLKQERLLAFLEGEY
jgi:hypothetical protein